MSTEKLYPSLNEDLQVIDLTEEEVKQACQEVRLQTRQEEFRRFVRDKQQQLNERLNHYSKLKHRWTIIRHVSEGLGATVTVLCAVITIVASTGALAVPILAVSTSSAGLLSPLLTALTNKTFINTHRQKIKEKHRKTKEILDKLYFSFSKASSDGVIS